MMQGPTVTRSIRRVAYAPRTQGKKGKTVSRDRPRRQTVLARNQVNKEATELTTPLTTNAVLLVQASRSHGRHYHHVHATPLPPRRATARPPTTPSSPRAGGQGCPRKVVVDRRRWCHVRHVGVPRLRLLLHHLTGPAARGPGKVRVAACRPRGRRGHAPRGRVRRARLPRAADLGLYAHTPTDPPLGGISSTLALLTRLARHRRRPCRSSGCCRATARTHPLSRCLVLLVRVARPASGCRSRRRGRVPRSRGTALTGRRVEYLWQPRPTRSGAHLCAGAAGKPLPAATRHVLPRGLPASSRHGTTGATTPIAAHHESVRQGWTLDNPLWPRSVRVDTILRRPLMHRWRSKEQVQLGNRDAQDRHGAGPKWWLRHAQHRHEVVLIRRRGRMGRGRG